MINAQKERQKRDQYKRKFLTCDFPQAVFEIPTTSSLTYFAQLLMKCQCLRPFVERYLPHEVRSDHPVLYDKYSLFYFSANNNLRRGIARIVMSKVFEEITLLAILVNSFFLLFYDYEDPENKGSWNKTNEAINTIFGVFYFLECALKILAQGFILHENAYLRSLWNWMDFSVVLAWVIEIVMQGNSSFKALRGLRVLRPLRSLKMWRAMRKLIQGLIDAIPSLIWAVIFMVFVFLQFAIFGTIQFNGAYYDVCRLTEEPLDDGTWPIDFENLQVCSPQRANCPAGRFCGGQKFDLSNVSELDYGFTTFDNIFDSFITVF